MPRIKLELPEKFFDLQIKIPIRITDINYGNHTGNDSIVAIIHEARVQFLHSLGYTEFDLESTGLIMADIMVEFKNESFYKDIIEVKIAAGDITRKSFELFYLLTTERNEREIVIAKAKTTMVCYDYKLKKITELPAKFSSLLQD